ncbi:MAG: hypothetical protein ACE365_04790 [Gammaproteobacteria bacterium]
MSVANTPSSRSSEYKASETEQDALKWKKYFLYSCAITAILAIGIYYEKSQVTHCENKIDDLSDKWSNKNCGDFSKKSLENLCNDDYTSDCYTLESNSDNEDGILYQCINVCTNFCHHSEQLNSDVNMLAFLVLLGIFGLTAFIGTGANYFGALCTFSEELRSDDISSHRVLFTQKANDYTTFINLDQEDSVEETRDQTIIERIEETFLSFVHNFTNSATANNARFGFFGHSNVLRVDGVEMKDASEEEHPLMSAENGYKSDEDHGHRGPSSSNSVWL